MSTFSKLLQEEKELNKPHWNSMSNKDPRKSIKDTIFKYKEIIVGADVCIKCLDELKKQQVIDDKTYKKNPVSNLEWSWLQKNIEIDGDVMINMWTGDVLGSEVDYTC